MDACGCCNSDYIPKPIADFLTEDAAIIGELHGFTFAAYASILNIVVVALSVNACPSTIRQECVLLFSACVICIKKQNKKRDSNPRVQASLFNGGEGSRTPVLNTFDTSISMFRRSLFYSPIIRATSASYLASLLWMSYMTRGPRHVPAYFFASSITNRHRDDAPAALITLPLRIRFWNMHLFV